MRPARSLVRYEFTNPRVTCVGRLEAGVLQATPRGEMLYAGVEDDAALVSVPKQGELWVRYRTHSEEPLVLRCRAKLAKSTAFDFVLERPVTGRWVSLRVPLERFLSFEGEPLTVGTPLHIFYVYCKTSSSRHSIDDLAVVSRE